MCRLLEEVHRVCYVKLSGATVIRIGGFLDGNNVLDPFVEKYKLGVDH